jgi:hypothetical protein
MAAHSSIRNLPRSTLPDIMFPRNEDDQAPVFEEIA